MNETLGNFTETLTEHPVSALFSFLTDVLLTRFIFALSILFIGLILGYLVGRLLRKGMAELELNKLFRNLTGADVQIEQILANVVSTFVYIVTVLLVLAQLGIAKFVVNALSVFLILLFFTLIFLGVKDFIPNVIAGMRINRNGQYKVGQCIIVGRVRGTIKHIDMLEIIVETRGGDTMLIPTSYLLHEKVRIEKKTTGSHKK